MLQDLRRRLFRRSARNFIGFDKYRKRGAYHWSAVQDNQDYRSLIEAISKFLRPDQVVLDIGCGDGAYLGFVASRIHTGVGIDAEAVAIDLAREKFKEHGITNCTVLNKTIGEARAYFRDNPNRFDLIWSADVIEHLPRPSELLELALEVGKPGAICLIGTPLYISDDLVSPHHVKEYTQEEIRAIIAPRMPIDQEIILPHSRGDGQIHQQGYFLAAARIPGSACK